MFNSLPIKKSFLVDSGTGTVLGPPNFPPYYQIMVDNFNRFKDYLANRPKDLLKHHNNIVPFLSGHQ